MHTLIREVEKQSLHDRVVHLVAQRWVNPVRYTITANPGSEKNRRAGREGVYPDLVGWTDRLGIDMIEWVAEVETEEDVTVDRAQGSWRACAELGAPFYLIVPYGYRTSTQILAGELGVAVTRVYEFGFVNGTFHLL
jgi:hypothetical protein